MDVYFSGYGRWANQINEDEFEPIGDDYEAGGVFKLRDIDYKTYGHTDDFNHVRRLLPSINNDDCEFKKIKDLYHYANPNRDPKFIYMDVLNRNPAFYCLNSYERINSIAIDNANNPTFLININKYNTVTAVQDWYQEQFINLPDYDVEIDDDQANQYPKPREGGYKERDIFAIKLVKDRPELLNMPKNRIKTFLLNQNSKLFTAGFDDWWRKQPIFPKGKPGRTPK